MPLDTGIPARKHATDLPAASAAGRAEPGKRVPGDILQRLALLGILEKTATDLVQKAGGCDELRLALDRLEERLGCGNLHSASGVLIRCVRELAKEQRAIAMARMTSLMATAPDAFKDPRWNQLPTACRTCTHVASAWIQYWRKWKVMVSMPTDNPAHLDLSDLAHAAWRDFLEICLAKHPAQEEIWAAIENRINDLDGPPSTQTRNRVRFHLLGQELGVPNS